MKKIKGILYTNRWYFLIIGLGTLFILLLNIFVFKPFYPNYAFELWQIFLWTFLDILFVFLSFALVSILTRALPKKCFDPYNKNFKVSQNEMKRLEKIGIKKWKDRVPEMGQYLVSFDKTKISNPNDSTYTYRFISETCYAEVMHGIQVVVSFWIIVLPWPISSGWLIGLPVALVSSFLHLLPVLIQRYNRAKLIRIYEKQVAHEQRKKEE